MWFKSRRTSDGAIGNMSEVDALRMANARLKEEVSRLKVDKARLKQELAEARLRRYGGSSDVRDSRPSTASRRRSSAANAAEIMQERRVSLGDVPIVMRANHVVQGVLPLAAAFDRFDRDENGSISLDELKPALEYLGVSGGAAAAEAVLKRYDEYPDRVLDVKEFTSLVRDINLLISHDADGDGALNAEELQGALSSLGVDVDANLTKKLMAQFDSMSTAGLGQRTRPPVPLFLLVGAGAGALSQSAVRASRCEQSTTTARWTWSSCRRSCAQCRPLCGTTPTRAARSRSTR